MKKFGAFLLAGVLAIGALTGCGSTGKKAESSTGSTDTQVIKVAASATPRRNLRGGKATPCQRRIRLTGNCI